MGGEKTTGQLSGITISEEMGYGEKVARGLPVVGGAVSAGIAMSAGDWRGTTVGAASFIQSCKDAATGIATDPLGWLIGQGLNFLITVVQPLQDLIHMVSGDGPALMNAASNFNAIAKGLAEYGEKFVSDVGESLKEWGGTAKDAAQKRMERFATGIGGTAGQSGDIAQLLQISSMIMTVIEEFIKALLTEFVEWLILIWIPALAAAAPTFGGSVAAAWTGTFAKGTHTTVKATKQVSKLQKILNMLKQLLDKLKTLMAKTKDFFKQAGTASKAFGQTARMQAKLGARERGGKLLDDLDAVKTFPQRLGEKGLDSLKGQYTDRGKIARNANNGYKAGEYGNTGSDQSVEETSEDLTI
ncbi:hypothetical protein [Actinophytocola sp. NPDC049390]|uniref:hypothetical protein n=1 Tax=Actinophytocola sp. NPDC049390 TaxID=3363894 RepID=UPI00379BCFB6